MGIRMLGEGSFTARGVETPNYLEPFGVTIPDMDLRRTLKLATDALTSMGVDHALIGGFALAVHGVHRATADIDFIADGSRVQDIRTALTRAGFSLFYESPEVLQFSGIGNLDVLLANRPLSMRMIRESKVEAKIAVRVLCIEDLVGLKIQAYCNDPSREYQDKADIQALLQAGSQLNWSRIEEYANLFDKLEDISKLRSK